MSKNSYLYGNRQGDLPAGKNLVGAFYQPKLVICDIDALNTLPIDVFQDGCAEVIKYGILYDEDKLWTDYKEMVYEGYGPFGIAFLVETATDNTTRTVANVRACFNKCGGSLGTSGSGAFMFEHKCTFKFSNTKGADPEELELEMIDLGVDALDVDEENNITVEAPFDAYGQVQKFLEDNGFEIISGEFVRIPTDTKEVTAEQRESLEKLIEKLEEDDDVTNVYTTMAEGGEE